MCFHFYNNNNNNNGDYDDNDNKTQTKKQQPQNNQTTKYYKDSKYNLHFVGLSLIISFTCLIIHYCRHAVAIW